MKRILIALGTAILFLNTLVIPTVAHADGVGGTSCGSNGSGCKP